MAAFTLGPGARQHTPAIDVHRHMRLERHLQSASQLAAGVAHDLNNILTSVLGFGTLLAEHVAGDGDASTNAQEVLTAAERAAGLTGQLLTFCSRQMINPARVELCEFLQEAEPHLKHAVGSAIGLQIAPVQNAPAVRIDRERLMSAILALAENARDAMPDGGRLEVSVDTVTLAIHDVADSTVTPGAYVRLSLTDTGRGIRTDIHDRIFEPFFTTKPRGQGAGLGLSMVYGFIRQSGGVVQVSSQPGRGSTFELLLPVTDDVQTTTPPTPRSRRPAAGETILLVDDDDGVRATVAEMLRKAGYRVIAAASASEALYMAATQRGPIHVLVTDIVMPGSSGLDLAAELRAERRALRVLYITAFADALNGPQGTRMRKDEGFLPKPFTAEALLHQVATLLT